MAGRSNGSNRAGNGSIKRGEPMKTYPICLMRRVFAVMVHVCLSAAAIAQSSDSSLNKPYGIKSGKIVHKFINGPQSGTKTLIFDDWGRTEKEEVTTISDTAV